MKEIPGYWDPIYIIEFNEPECLFPFRNSYFHETKEQIIDMAKRLKNVIRVIEKSMITGKETVIKELPE